MMLLRLGWLGISLAALVTSVGCQQPVKWTIHSRLDPDPVKIGQKYVSVCKITGELDKVGWVAAMPLVAPEFIMEMRDEGTEGDAKKGDGIFTNTGTPPEEAEPGEYEIEFVVYDKNGDPLQVPSFTILDKDGKGVLKEVVPEEGGGETPATVEFSSVVTIMLE